MITYWTLQKLEAWVLFEKQGYIEGNPEYAAYTKEYDWMKVQMKLRLPHYNDEQPIWLCLRSLICAALGILVVIRGV